MNNFKKKYWQLRRAVLKFIIPEFVWPENIEIDGVKFKLRNTPYSFATKLILKRKKYEVNEWRLLKSVLKVNDVVIEMGGSIGILTALIAKHIGTGGYIVSVEASERLTRYSKSWLENNPNVKVLTGFAFPVFKVENSIRITQMDESLGSLGGIVSYDMSENKSVKDISNKENPVYDINALMKYLAKQPTVLVIDVEGSEKIIIEQDFELPESVRIIVIELHPHFYGLPVRNKIIKKIEFSGFSLGTEISEVFLFRKNDDNGKLVL